ncbi:MAG: FAD-dependent oxidoreductase [Acidobacteriota bacterium]
MDKKQRMLVVGGVAGGASAAARARRLCETCEIIVFDKGPFASFANCGLPYYVGDVIKREEDLIVASRELFRARFNIDVRTRSEVLSIDRDKRTIEVKDLETGRTYREPYTALVLAPGARPVRPPIPGIDRPGIFVLRTIPDSLRIRAWLRERAARQAVVVGGGFIGLEMAENLARRDLHVTIVELANQILPPIDAEVAAPVQDHLKQHGVSLILGEGVAAFEDGADGGLKVRTQKGTTLPADVVILGVGVRPEVGLARDAGLELGTSGGIRVDESMRTSDPHIWAVGDAVEVTDIVTGARGLVPLAGPANRQGRIAANSIFRRPAKFRPVQATAVCGIFGLTVATTGAGERSLRRAGISGYDKIYLHPGHHAGYYPGAKPIHIKLLFDTKNGRVLGAQAVGEEGVARRIDVIAMAIQKGATVFDLEEAELCYAPQFGAAKDPVNLAGMIAGNVLRGDLSLANWEEIRSPGGLLLDVREASEFEQEHIPDAINIPLSELRGRLEELPADRDIWVYCAVGQRAYYASRLLSQRGFHAQVLSGGLRTYRSCRSILDG